PPRDSRSGWHETDGPGGAVHAAGPAAAAGPDSRRPDEAVRGVVRRRANVGARGTPGDGVPGHGGAAVGPRGGARRLPERGGGGGFGGGGGGGGGGGRRGRLLLVLLRPRRRRRRLRRRRGRLRRLHKRRLLPQGGRPGHQPARRPHLLVGR